MWWDGLRWFANVQFTITRRMLQPVIDYCMKANLQRYRGLPPGDAKDDLGRAIEALRRGDVLQNVVPDRDGYTRVFTSTERETARAYSIPSIRRH